MRLKQMVNCKTCRLPMTNMLEVRKKLLPLSKNCRILQLILLLSLMMSQKPVRSSLLLVLPLSRLFLRLPLWVMLRQA